MVSRGFADRLSTALSTFSLLAVYAGRAWRSYGLLFVLVPYTLCGLQYVLVETLRPVDWC